jgi:hypothetical protein
VTFVDLLILAQNDGRSIANAAGTRANAAEG